jgi:cell wall-associated NlpC family hydrolase
MKRRVISTAIFFLLVAGVAYMSVRRPPPPVEPSGSRISADSQATLDSLDVARSLEGVEIDEERGARRRARMDSVVAFAESLTGTPYLARGAHPDSGFDCSGFVSYVFARHGFDVPRSSSAYATFGLPVDSADARPGDILVFTGTDASKRTPGHVGVVTAHKPGFLLFVHSSSSRGVVTDNVASRHYHKRWLGVRRVIPQNESP